MDNKLKTHRSPVSDVQNGNKKRKLRMKGIRETDSGSGQYSGDEYEVSKILGRRVVDGNVEYLLLWAGFGLDESTWEREENLFCTKLLEEFNLEEAKREPSNCVQESTIIGSTSDSEDETIIDSLSPEIKREIFKRIESKTELRLVCSQWKHQVDSWFYNHHGILTDNSVSFIRNSGLQFDTITVQNLHEDLSSEKLKTTRSHTRSGLALNPRKLVFTDEDRRRSFTSVSYDNIELLMGLNTNVKSLGFNGCLFSNSTLNPFSFNFPNLTELEITLNGKSDVHNQKTVFHSISKLKLPSLTTMRINVEEKTDKCDQLYIGIYQLIASCNKSLKNLDVSCLFLFHNNDTPFVQKMDNSLPLSASRLALLRRHLSQIRLESLCISLDHFDKPECKNLAFLLLLSQNTLKNLEVRFHESEFNVVAPIVKKTIEENISSVVNLTFRRCGCSIFYGEISEANLLRSIFEPLMSICSHQLQAKLESLCVYGFHLTLRTLSTVINLSSLPPSIKRLKLAGDLDPQAFTLNSNGNGKSCLPLLEELVIFNTADTSRENYTVGKGHLNKILDMLPMLKLLKIYWRTDYFDLEDFQSTNQNIKIELADHDGVLGTSDWRVYEYFQLCFHGSLFRYT